MDEKAEFESWQRGTRTLGDRLNASSAYNAYTPFLLTLLELKASYEARYSHLGYKFEKLAAAQQLHESTRALVTSAEEVEAYLKDKDQMVALWKRIERVDKHIHGLRANESTSLAGLYREAFTLLVKEYAGLYAHLHEHHRRGTIGVKKPAARSVDRRHVDDLSVTEFVEKYARPGIPVIIEGLQVTTGEPWTLDFFKQRCNTSVLLKMKNDSKISWGRLQNAGVLNLPEFIDTYRENATRQHWYLHDWGLPLNCPDAFGPAPYREWQVPKYFAGDYFQRAPLQGYQHSWPSLFIGSNITESAMHVDSGGTNFWLHLLSGRKSWRFYSKDDVLNLYPTPNEATFQLDVFRPDAERLPLVEYAQLYEGIQEEGDLIFIPGGNPHGVRNLEHIHGVSMNYVDATNVHLYVFQMLFRHGWKSVEMMTDHVTVKHGIRSDQTSLSMGEWKSVPWKHLDYDIV